MNVQLQHVYIHQFLYFQSQIPAEKKLFTSVAKSSASHQNNKDSPSNTFYIKKTCIQRTVGKKAHLPQCTLSLLEEPNAKKELRAEWGSIQSASTITGHNLPPYRHHHS